MKHKFKVGDKVIWVKYIDYKGDVIPLEDVVLDYRELIKNKTVLTITKVTSNKRYSVDHTKAISQYLFEGELEPAKITNWKERIR